MNQLKLISQDFTKSQIKIAANLSVEEVLNNGNVLQSAEVISKIELFLKEIKSNKDYIDSVRTEIQKFGKDYKTSTGTKLELTEAGTKYDFANCNDKIYFELLNEFESIKDKIKNREEFLKKVPASGIEIVDENGEVYLIFPPSKSSTSTYKVTIQK